MKLVIPYLKKFHNQISNFAFSNNLEVNYTQKDHIQPLFIHCGKDSIDTIGDPKVLEKGATMNKLWESTYETIFPKLGEEKDKNAMIEELVRMKFNEPRIDAELANFERKYEIFNKTFNPNAVVTQSISGTKTSISPEKASPNKVAEKKVVKEER